MKKKSEGLYTELKLDMANSIRSYIQENDLKVYDLSRKIDVRETYLYRCLNHSNSVSLEKLIEIMKAAGIEYIIDISKI